MTGNSLTEISIADIQPSPYQHRRVFDEAALRELANSIERDGLIQPITVRRVNAHFELIAGERRWRAFQLAEIETIPARVLDADDLQARRLCATENLQRADLTPLEEVMALCELVDASLLEFSEEYAPLSPIQEPKWRVRTLLGKLESDRANKTDYFIHKFMDKVEEIAEAVDVAVQTASNWCEDFSKSSEIEELEKWTDFDVPLYNVWKQQNKSNAVNHFGNSEPRWLDFGRSPKRNR